MVNGIAGAPPGRAKAPRHAWYIVGFADEFTDKPLRRQVLGEHVVLYRTADGRPVMLSDRCAHRAMALSQGKIVGGDRIQCPYHGMEYDPTGACVLVPSQDRVPRPMKTRSFPLAERWRWVWAWMGPPERADEALIPDHALFGLAENDGFYKVQRFLMAIEGSYQFLHENLLDVSHISFLHEGSFDSGKIAGTPATTEVGADYIRIARRVTETVTGAYGRAFDLEDGVTVDRELSSRTWLPGLNVVTNIFSFPDAPERGEWIRHAPFAITPANDTACHYFVASAANYGQAPVGDALAASNRFVWEVFLTDKMAVESIQQTYLELGADTPDVSVRADEAAVRFRWLLEQQIKREETREAREIEA
jgi:nitrite reductase/ring-hydroxylating ferredoxin subunit